MSIFAAIKTITMTMILSAYSKRYSCRRTMAAFGRVLFKVVPAVKEGMNVFFQVIYLQSVTPHCVVKTWIESSRG